MSGTIEAGAPGKAVLSGEYAVLHGAPAVSMAVNRRAVVRIEAGSGDSHSVEAPGFSKATGRFRLDRAGVTWLDGGDDYALFDAILTAGAYELGAPRHFILDTQAFTDIDSGDKLGLGSSAALSAALAFAAAECDPGDSHPMIAAAGGHREFQRGSGSGVDVATSLAGGLIEYRMGEPGWLLLDWPDELHACFYYSGVASDTRDKIATAAENDDESSRLELVDAASRLANRWRQSHAPSIVDETRRYAELLRRFSDAHGLDTFAAGHDRMAKSADELELAYKPSGAGGGDIGVVLGTDRMSVDVFSSIAESLGFRPLDIELDPLGARVSQ